VRHQSASRANTSAVPPRPAAPTFRNTGAALPLGLISLWLALEGLSIAASVHGRSGAGPAPYTLVSQVLLHAAVALMAGRAVAAISGEARSLQWLLLLAGMIAAGYVFSGALEQTVATLTGLALGCALWWLLRHCAEPRRTTTLALLLLAAYTIGELAPFAMRDVPEPFIVAPFAEFTRGSALAVSHALLTTLYVFASILWLVRTNGVSPFATGIALAVIAAFLEALHILIIGRPPSITQPLLVLVLGALLQIPSRTLSPPRTAKKQSVAALQPRAASAPQITSATTATLHGVVIIAYIALIAYASLYPLTGWRAPAEPFWDLLSAPWQSRPSRSDLISNVLAYIPLGLMLGWRYRSHASPVMTVAIAGCVGAALSLSVEMVQTLLPARTPSTTDVLLNVGGTLMGACLASTFLGHAALAGTIRNLWNRWFRSGPLYEVGFAAFLLWVLSQWSPFVPSIDRQTIVEGLSAFWRTLQDPSLFRPYDSAAYALNIAGLGLLMSCLLKRGRPLVIPFAAVVAGVLAAKIFIASRQLSLEAACGLFIGAAVLAVAAHFPRKWRVYASVVCLTGGFAALELSPGSGTAQPFNWVPFAGEIENNLNGFANILAAIWPFLALGCLVNFVTSPRRRFEVASAGALVIAMLAFSLEWIQQFLPGRHGDVTTVLLAVCGWLVAWRWPPAKFDPS